MKGYIYEVATGEVSYVLEAGTEEDVRAMVEATGFDEDEQGLTFNDHGLYETTETIYLTREAQNHD